MSELGQLRDRLTPTMIRDRGRRIDYAEFREGVRSGTIADARIETFGDGYGHPYNPHRTVWGWIGDELVWSETEPGRVTGID